MIKIWIKPRVGGAYAEAEYQEKNVVVKAGGKISADFADHIQGGRNAKKYRENPDYVSADRVILKDCTFSSPSTAAQFVTGRSTNGYEAWKVEEKKSLGQYLREQGLR